MDKAIHEAIENEHDFNLGMDAFVKELEDLGVFVDIPYSFADLTLYEGEESIFDYVQRYKWTEEDEEYAGDWEQNTDDKIYLIGIEGG